MKHYQYFLLIFSLLLLHGCKVSYDKKVMEPIDSGAFYGGNFDGGDYNSLNETTPGVYLNAKVCLQGAVITPSPLTMSEGLNTDVLIPLSTPYTLTPPWNHNNSTDSTLFSLPPRAVDWVLVEVYTLTPDTGFGAFYSKSEAQSALLYSDGSIHSINPKSIDNETQGLYFPTLMPGEYYINVKHRNHLAIANISPVALQGTFNASTFQLDFTNTNLLISGHVKTVASGVNCMAAGDVNGDNIIDGTDLSTVNGQVNFILPSAVNGTQVRGYFNSDLNFNGRVIKQSTENTIDHNLIKLNISLSTVVHPNIP
jgi:hypothetical protein